jgi:hypothetical protein
MIFVAPKNLHQTWLAILLFVSICTDVMATVAVPIFAPPEALTISRGNAEMHPFDLGPARYQQVYDASTFTALIPSGGGLIREIALRAAFRPIFANVENMQINMSVTLREPDDLSAIFDENVGLADQVVVGPRRVPLFSLGPGAFDLTIILNQPFFYNPAEGNLLLDFRIFEGIETKFPVPGGAAPLDAFNTVGDSVSSIYGYGGIGGSMPASGQVSSAGLATVFRVVPIPEPSTLALMALGLGLLGGISWKRIKKKSATSGKAGGLRM